MDKKMKQLLQEAYTAPKPKKKEEFLRNLNYPKIRYRDFIWYQAGYISKNVWIFSFLLIFGMLIFQYQSYIIFKLQSLWAVSSLLPLLVLIFMTELSRSASFAMEELESSCKYNLADILLVRMSLLAGFDFLLMLPLLYVLTGKYDYSLGRLLAYMLLPFFFTSAVSFLILNHWKIKEFNYVCAGVSFFTAGINGFVSMTKSEIFGERYTAIWEIALMAAIVIVVAEVIVLRRKTEELQWNLTWIE